MCYNLGIPQLQILKVNYNLEQPILFFLKGFLKVAIIFFCTVKCEVAKDKRNRESIQINSQKYLTPMPKPHNQYPTLLVKHYDDQSI